MQFFVAHRTKTYVLPHLCSAKFAIADFVFKGSTIGALKNLGIIHGRDYPIAAFMTKVKM